MKLTARLALLLALALLAAACGGGSADTTTTTTAASGGDTTTTAASGGEETTTTEADEPVLEELELVYGQFGWTADHWPVYIAQEEGFFEEVGLTVDQIVPGDARQFLPALLSGDMDVAVGGQFPFIVQNAAGADTVAVFSFRNTASHTLIATVETYDELRGGLVGVSAEVSADGALLEAMLEAEGLILGEDYDFIVVGGTTDRAAALESKGIQAGLIAQPIDFVLQERPNLFNLGNTAETAGDFAWQWGQVTRDWLGDDENVEKLDRFLRATLKATAWFYDPANRDAAVAHLVTHTESEVEAAEQTYDLFQSVQAFPADLRPTVPGFEAALRVVEEGGELEGREAPTSDEFIDFTYIDAANQ